MFLAFWSLLPTSIPSTLYHIYQCWARRPRYPTYSSHPRRSWVMQARRSDRQAVWWYALIKSEEQKRRKARRRRKTKTTKSCTMSATGRSKSWIQKWYFDGCRICFFLECVNISFLCIQPILCPRFVQFHLQEKKLFEVVGNSFSRAFPGFWFAKITRSPRGWHHFAVSTYTLLSSTMSAPKSKTTSNSNGTAKGKTASTSGTATPVSTIADKDSADHLVVSAGGKPDKALYDSEQARVKSEIDALQAKLVSVVVCDCILWFNLDFSLGYCSWQDIARDEIRPWEWPPKCPSRGTGWSSRSAVRQ